MRLLQDFELELGHLEHRGENALRLRWIFVLKHHDRGAGDDLPREAVAVFEPAALALAAALGKFFPEAVDLGLRVTVYDERDRLGKLKNRPAVQHHEFLAGEAEADGHDRAGRAPGGFRAFGAVAVTLSIREFLKSET